VAAFTVPTREMAPDQPLLAIAKSKCFHWWPDANASASFDNAEFLNANLQMI
jgi:hypothetical protein